MDRTALPEEAVKKFERLTRAIEVFREFDAGFPTSYAVAFLYVAMEQGKGVSEYARDMGVVQPVASRVLLEIGAKSRSGGEGLGLIEQDFAPNSLRSKQLFLTAKGRQLARKLELALGRDF